METPEHIRTDIFNGDTFLGIELGSTRIKASLIDREHRPIASGSFAWENRLEDGGWTYRLEDAISGVQACYADLLSNVRRDYCVTPSRFGAIGISGMMHGYLPLDRDGRQLAPFRTWRNTMTGEAAEELTELFGQNIPQRWSIAHLYHSILQGEEHVCQIASLTTLAGYIHRLLTGENVLGIDEASGMFPIDAETKYFHAGMLSAFDALIGDNKYSWKLADILPRVAVAGEQAGRLTKAGALLLDPTGSLEAGVPFCPPEGDAGTGMVATDSVLPRTGNVSVGTSVFGMIVLEQKLKRLCREIDLVTTPSGDPVAMVHCNNGTSDLDAWINLIRDCMRAYGFEPDERTLYQTLFRTALEGEADCGGLVGCNYLSGEHTTNFTSGRPLFLRLPDARFSSPNFMRAQLYGVFASLRLGMDILTKGESVAIDNLNGHGGFFRVEGVGQHIMAAALNAPVTVMETAGDGGPWGMAILAAYMVQKGECEKLSDYLDKRVFAGSKRSTYAPNAEETQGFERYLERYRTLLNAERAALEIG